MTEQPERTGHPVVKDGAPVAVVRPKRPNPKAFRKGMSTRAYRRAVNKQMKGAVFLGLLGRDQEVLHPETLVVIGHAKPGDHFVNYPSLMKAMGAAEGASQVIEKLK